jgi:hypothetical protein
MSEIDGKGINQLLLSPLYLLNHIFGVLMPGAFFLLLLALKGNVLLRNGWTNPLFGYKTKVALFILLAYVVGSMLRLPLQWLAAAFKPFQTPATVFKNQHPEVQKALTAILTDGVLIARPFLLDRLSLLQSNVAFHIGVGIALLVAAFVPGDGSLRWLEAFLGTAMFVTGFRKGKDLVDETIGAIGIGLAHVIGGMTAQQMTIAKATLVSLGILGTNPEVAQATVITTEVPESPKQADAGPS